MAVWRVVPIMLLGFVFTEALIWGLFYSGSWYYPQSDDMRAIAAIGCNTATLLGAGQLIVRRPQLATNLSQRLALAVPLLCFGWGIFLGGAFARCISEFAMDRFTPEPVGLAAACVCATGIWLASLLPVEFQVLSNNSDNSKQLC